jgi:hypothetical protein
MVGPFLFLVTSLVEVYRERAISGQENHFDFKCFIDLDLSV